MLALAAVLSLFEESIVREVTDPRCGISTREKFRAFPPNSGELKAFCEEAAARRARIDGYAKLPPVAQIAWDGKPSPGSGRRANLLVRRGRPKYEAMVERAKIAEAAEWQWHPDGIRVPLDWYLTRPPAVP